MTGKHSNHWRRPVVRVPITCEVCGTTKHYAPSQARQRTGRFCSQACFGRSVDTRVLLPCAICGVEVLRRRLKVGTAVYCSPAHAQQAKRVEGAKWRDPIQIKDYMRAYVAKNRVKHNAKGAEWARNNRDKRNELQQARRSSYAGHFPRTQWLQIKKSFGFICLRCQKPETLLLKLEPDHVVPIARGGAHHASNIQPLCRSCNAWKGARTIDYRHGITITEITS